MLIAPDNAPISPDFGDLEYDPPGHEELLASMQRLRGSQYLQDGAISADELSPDGRHRLSIDDKSWHLLSVDSGGLVCGCVRYRKYANTAEFDDLGVRNSALARWPHEGLRLRRAVETELGVARLRQVSYVEVGGWAVAPEYRFSTEALRTALATYALARNLGGCLGITTATVRHASSSILRKIGGSSLQWDGKELPAYYDPQYRCEMEILRFDSKSPAGKYAQMVDQLSSEIRGIPVICRTRPTIFQFPAYARGTAREYPDRVALPCTA
ncbi:MAG: hypothetical protein P4L56_21335 [Candidatus Sulfopaludibacter sp.]|nr:hypothetical protein [Candidatus Sulfopaludibacter sp.]